jgi:uncharacterized protein
MIAGRMSTPSDVSDSDAPVAEGKSGALLRVRVRPRSSRRGVLGVSGGALVIGVGAAPEKGRATAEAVRALAGWLGVAPSRLAVVSGATSRSKRVAIAGMSAVELRARLGSFTAPDPS